MPAGFAGGLHCPTIWPHRVMLFDIDRFDDLLFCVLSLKDCHCPPGKNVSQNGIDRWSSNYSRAVHMTAWTNAEIPIKHSLCPATSLSKRQMSNKEDERLKVRGRPFQTNFGLSRFDR